MFLFSLFSSLGQCDEVVMTQEVASSVDPAIILLVPLPSNSVRGLITGCLDKVTDKFPQIKQGAILLSVVEAVYLFFAARTWSSMDGPIVGCAEQMELFRQERNLYLNGFGLFLTMTIARVYRLQTQLFEARKLAKKAKKQ